MARDRKYIYDDIKRLEKEIRYESDNINKEILKSELKDCRNELYARNNPHSSQVVDELEILNAMGFN